MKLLLFLPLLLAACANPYAPNPMYARDDLYCWHLRNDGHWQIRGLSETCPPNAGKR